MIFDIWGKLEDLERAEKAVLGWLVENANTKTWKVSFMQKDLMKDLGYTQATISRGINKLRELGYVQGKLRVSTVRVDFKKLKLLRDD